MKILDVRTPWEGWLKLRVATVRTSGGQTVEREFVTPRRAVGVLPYNPVRRCALMVEQARPAVLFEGGPPRLLEAAAGLIDEGEGPEDAVRREAMEELGLRLTNLQPVVDAWTSPGPSSERIALFLAEYTAEDRVAAGGGLAGEHEDLNVVEPALADLWSQARQGLVPDLKTAALVFALRAMQPSLFV